MVANSGPVTPPTRARGQSRGVLVASVSVTVVARREVGNSNPTNQAGAGRSRVLFIESLFIHEENQNTESVALTP